MKPTIAKLGSAEHCGDWHDKPLRYIVTGLPEVQKFSTKKDAEKWARLRPKFPTYNETFHAWMKQAGVYA